jgi:uncharacterized membrane protein YbhN (UPF0104 family)
MAEREREIFGVDRKKAVLSVVLGLVLVTAAVAGIGQITSFHHMVRALRDADTKWFPVCLAGEILAYVGFIAAYRDIARIDNGPVFPLWTATRVVAIGFGAYALGTSAGSLGLDYWALHRAGETSHMALRRVLGLAAGGSGGIEAGLAFSLNAVGIPLAQALVATLVYRFFTLWLPILPAALAATRVRELDRELPLVPRASIS